VVKASRVAYTLTFILSEGKSIPKTCSTPADGFQAGEDPLIALKTLFV
jgi:hypothetical protein